MFRRAIALSDLSPLYLYTEKSHVEKDSLLLSDPLYKEPTIKAAFSQRTFISKENIKPELSEQYATSKRR
jgi:hypothetical protein